MSNVVWLRGRRELGVSVTSGARLAHVGGRGVRLFAPSYAVPTGAVRPQAGAAIAAMADITPDAHGKGLFAVHDWSPPA
ncbi:MAG: hypothetical protein ACODAF_06550 [Actinomycetota bacterium]